MHERLSISQRPSSENRYIDSRGGPPPRARVQRPAGAGEAARCAGGRRGLIGRLAAAVGGAPFNFRVPMRTGLLHLEAASPSSPNLPELAPAAFRGDGLYIEGQHTLWGASWVARTGTEWRWRLGCSPPPRDVQAGGSIFSPLHPRAGPCDSLYTFRGPTSMKWMHLCRENTSDGTNEGCE